MVVQKNESSGEMCASRSGRVFHRDGAWYFRTREGHEHGPYNSKKTVVKDLARYMDLKLVAVSKQK